MNPQPQAQTAGERLNAPQSGLPQPCAPGTETGPAPASTERRWVWLLCCCAAVHVFLFSAAFPFFNIVDEELHLDLTVRYAQGAIPRTLPPPSEEALPFIVIYRTPEYLQPLPAPPGEPSTPLWKQPFSAVQSALVAKAAAWRTQARNHEASQPPLYYSLAAAWWRLGKALGLDGAQLLYWLRFLNVPLLAVLVWLGWLAARQVFPDNPFVRLAVPGLIAFMPQTTFYALNNDILSPLTFGAAFLLLLRWWSAEAPSPRLAAATGLALAATFLTKISNLPLLAVAAVFVALNVFRQARNGALRPAVPSLLLLAACAGLPAAAWTAWCKAVYGDFTGSGLKYQVLGWTDKPLAAWFHHPIYTPRGLWTFIRGNLATFWQGELLWHRQPLSFAAADWVYTVLTLALLCVALAVLLRRPSTLSPGQRTAAWLGVACFAAAFAFFALLSVKYDFQDCFYPSRQHPYFTSGRLMLGLLIPLLLLLACGLDRVLGRFNRRAQFAVLAVLLLCMLTTEIATDWNVFASPYNWFHL